MDLSEQEKILQWLRTHCPLKIEYDFWYQFFDDLEDCFDGLEPWLIAPDQGWDWGEWDKKFTGRRVKGWEPSRRGYLRFTRTLQ